MACDVKRECDESFEESPSPWKASPVRIETQIHRRSKAKAIFPLEAEWQVGADRPVNLKMPADKMDTHGNVGL